MSWDKKEGRCEMYCANLSDEDWLSICDCREAERCVTQCPCGDPSDCDTCQKPNVP